MKYVFFLLATVFSLTVFSQQFELSTTSSFSVDGTSTLLDWTVVAQKYSGSLNIKAKKNSKSSLKKGSITAIDLVIPVNSMISEKGSSMDNKMYRALKMEEFPEMTYSLTTPGTFELLGADSVSLNTTGILEIAGVKKTIQCELQTTYVDGILKLSGSTPLKLSDFDMERPSAMFGQIETHDDITVNFVLAYKRVN